MPKIVVGLGNPGAKYSGTRHNIGFEVLDQLYAKYGSPGVKIESDGKTTQFEIGGTKLILVWPLTYMNNSGRYVQSIVQFYKINKSEDLLVICDDLSLPLGKLRIRPQGSAGGQKGLADILQRMGDQQVPRLRIGIDATPAGWDTADYVLSKFRTQEREVVDAAVQLACQAVEAWCDQGLSYCMNKFNK